MDQLVTRPVAEVSHWPTVGHPGSVPLEALIPDPEQPRKIFGETELDALALTMKSGGQREIVTVRELTGAERKLYAPARYMIVSGERRWRAATRAGLIRIEIRVKHYQERRDQMLDAYMLNESRVGLTDLEHAYYVSALAEKFEWETQQEIADKIGRDTAWVSQHLALLRLSPQVQARMKPPFKERYQIRMGAAVFLSRFSHVIQDQILEKLPDTASVGDQRAWMERYLEQQGIELPARHRKPSTERRMLAFFSKQLGRRVANIMAGSEFGAIFENASKEQVKTVLDELRDSFVPLQTLFKRLQQLANQRLLELAEGNRLAARIAPEVLAVVPPTPRIAPVRDEAEEDDKAGEFISRSIVQTFPPTPSPKSPVFERPTPAPAFTHKRRPVPLKTPKGPSIFGSQQVKAVREPAEITCSFWGTTGRFVTEPVSVRKYIELWDKGLLKFQQQNTEKPDFLPTREEAQARF